MAKEFEPWVIDSERKSFESWDWLANAQTDEGSVQASQETDFAIECERIRSEAREQGYQEGLAKASAEADNMHEAFEQWLRFIQHPVQLLDDALTDELLHTVLWLCQHCIGITLKVNPEQLKSIVDEIKTVLPAVQADKTLVMNPEDIEWLKKNLKAKDKSILEILCPEEQLARGDFYLKSQNSELDGTLKTRLQHIFNTHLPQANVDFDEEEA